MIDDYDDDAVEKVVMKKMKVFVESPSKSTATTTYLQHETSTSKPANNGTTSSKKSPTRTSPHRPTNISRNVKMFSGSRFLKLLSSPKIIDDDE